jgi:hypothetical protein
MKSKLRILAILIGTAVLFAACQEDKIDTTPPGNVSGLAATPKNQSVLISWTNPVDDDFASTKIVFEGETIEIGKEDESRLFEGLENGIEYTFEVSTVDLTGNSSEPVILKSTPDKYVTKVEGRNIEPGTYESVGGSFPVTIVINADDYKRTLTAGGADYIWEGFWAKENDTSYLFHYEYYTDDYRGITHVANITERKNAAFCYDYSDTTFYTQMVYEKIEGNEDFISGEYRLYSRAVSDDPAYSDTTCYYASFTEAGIVTYSDSDNNIEIASWKNEDLLDGKFIFVLLNSKTYLIDRSRWIRYMKK